MSQQEIIFLTYDELMAVEKACHRVLHLKGPDEITWRREVLESALRKLEAKADEVDEKRDGGT